MSKKEEPSKKKVDWIKNYPLNEPYASAMIIREKDGQIRYLVHETAVTQEEKKILEEIKEILIDEFDVDIKRLGTTEKVEQYLLELVSKVIKDYDINVKESSLKKLEYYLTRDFVYFDKIDPLMRDPNIEDIGCNGYNLPVYIWHRDYESIPTNVIFPTAEELDRFVVKLTYMTRRSISIAQPVVDASLPDGSRVQVTYEKEVTRHGSSFSIRKFRADPFTVTDLIQFNTFSPIIAAWFWYLVENRASVGVIGGTASGKTTTLNTLSMFIKPDSKIISIEDTAELQLPHENWLPSVIRTGFGVTSKLAEISLFDLLRNAMRQRPEYIIVGEVRGSEAFTLFQAIATGHGGLYSLHADSVDAAIHRLESEPMNIPRSLITSMDVVAVQALIKLEDKSVRRLLNVTEIVGIDPATKELLTNDIFKWNPNTDSFTYYGRSYVLERMAEKFGVQYKQIMEEIEKRRIVLDWMRLNSIRSYKEVANVIRSYYLDPDGLLKQIGKVKK